MLRSLSDRKATFLQLSTKICNNDSTNIPPFLFLRKKGPFAILDPVIKHTSTETYETIHKQIRTKVFLILK